MNRVFVHFDTSSISTTPQDAVIKITVATNTSADIIVVRSNAMGADGSTALAASEFFSSIDYSVPFSSEVTSLVNGNNDITLNAAGLSRISSSDNLTVAIIEHDSDFQNTANTTGTVAAGINFGSNIVLSYTEGVSGYGHKVNGVASGSIGKVNTVATASIEKVNTVD